MLFDVSSACIDLGLRAGAIVFRKVQVGPASAELRAEIAAAAQQVQKRHADIAALRSLPEVMAFHDVLRRVGVNPRRLQPSVERLLIGALKRGDLPAINSLVDAYNLVSLRTLCSLGAHDLHRIALPVSLQILTGAESFTPLGAQEAVTITAGEYGYVDAQQRLLCRLDVVQADFSKVTPQSSDVLLIVEGTAAHRAELMERALHEAIEQVCRWCGGSAEIARHPGELELRL